MKKGIPLFLSLTPLYFLTGLIIAYFIGNAIISGASEITAVPNFGYMHVIINVLFYLFVATIAIGLFFIISDIVNKERRLKKMYIAFFFGSLILCRIVIYLFENFTSVNLITWLFG